MARNNEIITQKKFNKISIGLASPEVILGNSRMLLYLLSNSFYGDNNELESSPLLSEINSKMIRSITSISAPNNGTTLTGIVTKTIPFIQYFVGIAGLVSGNRFFDID